jgi:8-oxo-dGTP pyrophosphatase MutT (NUDIX family)
MSGLSDQGVFLDTSGLPLTPDNAVAAIIMVDHQYLLQHRDDKPGIFFPDHWGCFGGAIESPESVSVALLRELTEELNLSLTVEDLTSFTRFDFDLKFAGCGSIFRTFFEVHLSSSALANVRLGEGQNFGLFSAEDILGGRLQLTPYDSFALWMHINRQRLKPAS